MIVGSVWRVPKATMMPTNMEATVDRPSLQVCKSPHAKSLLAPGGRTCNAPVDPKQNQVRPEETDRTHRVERRN